MFIIDKIRNAVIKQRTKIAEVNSKSIATAMLHQQTFPRFKNCCAGKKIVVCAAGPTLQKYQPIDGAVHIAVNRSFLYDKVKFDYIFAQDWDGIKMVQKELIEYYPDTCIKLLGSYLFECEKCIPESFAIAAKALRFNMDYYIYGNGNDSKFVRDLEFRPIGGMPNVGIAVLQFALYMNPSELYIVGCDMSGAHFSKGNENAKEAEAMKKLLADTWKNDHDRLMAKWAEFKDFAKLYYPDTKIYSVNPVALRGLFNDIDQ